MYTVDGRNYTEVVSKRQKSFLSLHSLPLTFGQPWYGFSDGIFFRKSFVWAISCWYASETKFPTEIHCRYSRLARRTQKRSTNAPPKSDENASNTFINVLRCTGGISVTHLIDSEGNKNKTMWVINKKKTTMNHLRRNNHNEITIFKSIYSHTTDTINRLTWTTLHVIKDIQTNNNLSLFPNNIIRFLTVKYNTTIGILENRMFRTGITFLSRK